MRLRWRYAKIQVSEIKVNQSRQAGYQYIAVEGEPCLVRIFHYIPLDLARVHPRNKILQIPDIRKHPDDNTWAQGMPGR